MLQVVKNSEIISSVDNLGWKTFNSFSTRQAMLRNNNMQSEAFPAKNEIDILDFSLYSILFIQHLCPPGSH